MSQQFGLRREIGGYVPLTQRLLEKVKTVFADIFTRKDNQTSQQINGRKKYAPKPRVGEYCPPVATAHTSHPQPAAPVLKTELPVGEPAALTSQHRIRRKPVKSQLNKEAAYQQQVLHYQSKPLPPLPLKLKKDPEDLQEDVRDPQSTFTKEMASNTHKTGSPGLRRNRSSRLDMPLPPLPQPEHGDASSLFPEPLSLGKGGTSQQVRHSMPVGPLGSARAESGPSSRGVVGFNNDPNKSWPDMNGRRGAVQHGWASSSPTPSKAIAPVPEQEAPAPSTADQEPERPNSVPPQRTAPTSLRHNAPMHYTAVRAVASWLHENLGHVPYVVTSLSALALWGFRYYQPTHVTLLCPEHCRDVITSWAVSRGVLAYARPQSGFGVQLAGEPGVVRRVRVKFVDGDEFAGLGTAKAAAGVGGRVLSLASLVDVLAGEFMDMGGQRAGEKRVVIGGGISWAVDRMVSLGAGVGDEELRNVGNPLFLEPFECTFPGSRETFVKAGLIQGEEKPPQRPAGLKGKLLSRMSGDGKQRAPWGRR